VVFRRRTFGASDVLRARVVLTLARVFFIALGQGAVISNSQFLTQVTQFSFRIGHTLRF
jgi:hypothetical protein